jgi:Ran GTPase-activating protein (RanGAP) involved in mRNA processing and transport
MPLRILQLDDCLIGDEGLSALAQGLNGNTTLRNIGLQGNKIGDAGGQALAEMLQGKTGLAELNLRYNDIGTRGVQALAQELKTNKTLTTLDLRLNILNHHGALALAEALTINVTLINLNLDKTGINNDDAKLFVSALNSNTSLTFLGTAGSDLSENFLMEHIESELQKNRLIFDAALGAKAAMQRINAALGQINQADLSRGVSGLTNPEVFLYPPEIMDLLVDQMGRVGLKQELIDLSNDVQGIRGPTTT